MVECHTAEPGSGKTNQPQNPTRRSASIRLLPTLHSPRKQKESELGQDGPGTRTTRFLRNLWVLGSLGSAVCKV